MQRTLETAFGHIVRDTARPISLGFGLFIAYTAWRERDLLGTREWPILAADVVVAVYLLGLAAWLWLRPPPLSWMNGLGASIAFALGGTDTVTMAVRGAVPSFPSIALVMAGIGLVVLSWRWLAATLLVLWVGWLWATSTYAINPDGSRFTLQIFTILGLAAHWGRHRAYKQLVEAREKERAALRRLQVVNQELDRFASVVAHDLKNPVSAIRLKAGALQYRVGQADENSRRILAELDHVTMMMGRMLDDLLAFARAGEKVVQKELVDLDEVVGDVRELFQERLAAVGGHIEVVDLPDVPGDPTQLHQLIQNLLGNALAYRDEQRAPQVSITGEVVSGGVVIRFQDNGRGFEQAQAERLFQPFERGHDDVKGHGIGLATCRRIVEGHGGTITASGAPGKGAMFTVFLPAPPQAEGDAGS